MNWENAQASLEHANKHVEIFPTEHAAKEPRQIAFCTAFVSGYLCLDLLLEGQEDVEARKAAGTCFNRELLRAIIFKVSNSANWQDSYTNGDRGFCAVFDREVRVGFVAWSRRDPWG